MLEYHGWVVVESSTDHDVAGTELDRWIRSACRELDRPDRPVLVLGANAQCCVVAYGNRNHAGDDQDIVELFRAIALRATGSYGLLYVWDNEHLVPDRFRVFVLRNGSLTVAEDPFLSPRD